MIRKLEVLANVAVIITSVILCSVLVRKYFFSATKQEPPVEAVASKLPSSTPSQRRPIQAGTKISLAGIDWSRANRTVVLALSTGCHFCSESAAFYQRLQREKPSDVRLIAVLPQPIENSKGYLDKLGVTVSEIVQAPLSSVGVSGTPTLLLIDSDGTVRESWRGKLSDEEATNVIVRVNGSVVKKIGD